MNRVCWQWALVGAMCLAGAREVSARTGDAILADLKANALPAYDFAASKTNPTYRNEYMKVAAAAQGVRAGLIGELAQAAPDSPELPKLLAERWHTLKMAHEGKTAVAEITAYLAAHPDTPIKSAAAFMRVGMEIEQVARDGAGRAAAIAAFEAALPGDPRLPEVLQEAWAYSADRAEKDAYLARLQKEFPESRSTKFVAGGAHALASIGKPFDLAFKDVLTDKQISIKDLKGKVVVIDFWATWCGPCMAEMPNMKKLYARYKDQGVEFIGVSLDQPGTGLDKLKACLADNGMTWPQYYQGNGWDSAFSVSWGVSSIPRVFVVDAQGNLVDINARARLETVIPKLLKDAAAEASSHVAVH